MNCDKKLIDSHTNCIARCTPFDNSCRGQCYDNYLGIIIYIVFDFDVLMASVIN